VTLTPVEGKENSGALTVEAISNVSYNTTADGSAVVTPGENQTVGTSVGVAVVVQVVNASNEATVTGGKITATDLTVNAASGSEEAAGGSKAKAEAGYSAGNFGLGGAIAVNVYNATTKAYVGAVAEGQLATLIIGGEITINAAEISEVETTATTQQDDNSSDGKIGVGTGIAVSVATVKTNATIDKANVTKIADLTITASSSSDVNVSAEAGAAGGTAIVTVLALNININEVNAGIGSSLTLAG
jgi:hypothetical protein